MPAIPPPPEATTTTELDLVISPDDGKQLVLSEDELELTEEAAERSTTTTVASTTTTVVTTTTAGQAESGGSGGTTATTAPPTTAPPATAAGGYNSGYESEFRSLINSYRSSNGLAALSSNGDLNSRARWWAKQMAVEHGLSHSSLASLVPPWSAAAENVGVGGSVSGVFGLLKGSGGHSANMLGDYTHVGVGVWVDSSGAIWTAHVFAR